MGCISSQSWGTSTENVSRATALLEQVGLGSELWVGWVRNGIGEPRKAQGLLWPKG